MNDAAWQLITRSEVNPAHADEVARALSMQHLVDALPWVELGFACVLWVGLLLLGGRIVRWAFRLVRSPR